MDASIAEARMQAEAAEQKADNWAQSEVAKIDADLAIARQETDKRVKGALSRREAMIQEARGQVLAQIAQVKAEIGRQTARALQVERRLEADVIQPCDAERQSLEEAARGAAASIVENGRAEADALKRLAEEYKRAGTNAREVLRLQQTMPLISEIAGSGHPFAIHRLTVLPRGTDGDGSAARGVIAAAEQIRSATGIDLAEVVRRIGRPPEGAARPLPAAPAAQAIVTPAPQGNVVPAPANPGTNRPPPPTTTRRGP